MAHLRVRLASTRYSPLDQINADNFSKIEVAWRFKTDSLGPRPEFNLQTTPLMVGGRLFFTAGTRRAAVSVDATTGEMLWMHSLNEGERGARAPRLLSGRGLAHWSDGKESRIIYVTPGYQMIALDAVTGDRIRASAAAASRSQTGHRSEARGNRRDRSALGAGRAKDVVIIGAAHLPGGSPRAKETSRATSAGSMCGRASGCGSSTPSRARASSATTPG